MLAADWGEPRPTAALEWEAGERAIAERYRGTVSAKQLDDLLRLATVLGTTNVVLESPYVDFDYRSEYSQHHARRFRPPPDVNERVLFRAGSRLVGSSVMRPISKPVGRTLMAVPEVLRGLVAVTAPETVRAFGQEQDVVGFPFVSQDGEYARCAHAAIWSIARWAHLEHDLARHSMAEVVLAAGVGQLPDRTVVSGGLNMQEVANAFRRLDG